MERSLPVSTKTITPRRSISVGADSWQPPNSSLVNTRPREGGEQDEVRRVNRSSAESQHQQGRLSPPSAPRPPSRGADPPTRITAGFCLRNPDAVPIACRNDLLLIVKSLATEEEGRDGRRWGCGKG